MKLSLIVSGVALALALPAQAQAQGQTQTQGQAISQGQRLAATCANCHGTTGAATGNALPSLAGMPAQQIVASMQAFKSGARQATIMHQLAKGYTDEQIRLMADWFAAQKP